MKSSGSDAEIEDKYIRLSSLIAGIFLNRRGRSGAQRNFVVVCRIGSSWAAND